MEIDLRSADSLSMWTFATVKNEHDGSGALQNLPVTTMPSTAHEEYLSEQRTWIGVHEKSRVKVSLLRSTAPWCWVITWKFSAKGTVSDKACTFLYTNNVPRTLEVACQRVRVQPLAGPGRRLCRSDFKRGRETGGANDPEIREASSQSLYRREMRVAHLLDEHG